MYWKSAVPLFLGHPVYHFISVSIIREKNELH